MTNHHWSFSIKELERELGVSGLLPGAGGPVPIAGECGHVTLAAGDETEDAVIAWLRDRFGHASAERALSGPGLVSLHRAAAERAGREAPDLLPGEVVARARSGTCDNSRCAIDLFFRSLGSVAGNLGLTLSARGGVYIGGGIAPQLLPEIERSRFRARFEGKGRFQGYLAAIPTLVITAPESPALLGASHALDLALATARTGSRHAAPVSGARGRVPRRRRPRNPPSG